MLKATQADREAAASIGVITEMRELIRAGQCDAHDYVQAFAAHRIAAEARAGKLAEALAGIMSHLDNGRNAPGHGHAVPGVWDNDISNGDKAGQPCEWCARWSSARTALAEYNGEATDG